MDGKAFPEPWRAMIAASDWVDEKVSFVHLRSRLAKNVMWNLGTSSRDHSSGDEAVRAVDRFRRRDEGGNVAWLKTALHSLPHPKAEFRRLVVFLGELVPKPGVLGVEVDPG